MNVPPAWTKLPAYATPATGHQPVGSTMLLQHVNSANTEQAHMPALLNSADVGPVDATLVVVGSNLFPNRGHVIHAFSADVKLNEAGGRVNDGKTPYRFNVQSTHGDGDFGNVNGASIAAHLNETYWDRPPGPSPQVSTVTLSAMSTLPPWVELTKGTLLPKPFETRWVVFVWVPSPKKCAEWTIPGGAGTYVLFGPTYGFVLTPDCKAPPCSNPPCTGPNRANWVLYAEILGGAAAALLLASLVLPARFAEAVRPARFLAIILAASAAALGVASALPVPSGG